MDSIKEATEYIQENTELENYSIGLTLGSGLGSFKQEIDIEDSIPYGEIPGFHESTVEGHTGELVFGYVEDRPVVAQNGRIHYYETGRMEEVVFPIRVLDSLDVSTLVLTNAAGGINPSYEPSDLMIIEDHINNMGDNPLIGTKSDNLPRFPDMSEVYSTRLRQIARKKGENNTLDIHSGVYVANSGPSFETPAEIEMLDVVGGDAVGMSTVPEAIVANQYDIEVLGISTITNLAAGVSDEKLSHSDVQETASQVESGFNRLMRNIIDEI